MSADTLPGRRPLPRATARPCPEVVPLLARGVAAGLLFFSAACRPVDTRSPLDPARLEPAIPARVAARFPDGWRFSMRREPVFAPHAMVASNSKLASDAGVEILRQGGNAVDAAVAVGFALAVTLPEAGNLGGGGYMVIRLADGRTAALDYREKAPRAATRDMYIGPDGNVTSASLVGPLASGVPGAVAGMAEAHRKYGSLPLAIVIGPAIRLAADGFAVDAALNSSLAGSATLLRKFAGAARFLPGGAPLAVGARLVQPELAETLRLIAQGGADAFYKGRIADDIVSEMRLSGGGIITKRDLADYRAAWRTPLRGTYRGYTLLTMPPSSSGGVTISETLNILEAHGSSASFGNANQMHVLASAYQRAFLDRNSKLGDPDFVSVPLSQLTSKDYAKGLARTIGAGRSTPTVSLVPGAAERSHTTHYSVVDQFGNAVATTTTINDLYGSGVYVRGAGFFLNDEMDDFAAKPGTPNQFGLVQGEQNAIAPGKRMLSAMAPTIVLDPAGEFLLATGARGGPRIITSTSQVILNIIDHRMDLSDAMRAPRLHHQSLPDSLRLEAGGFAPSVIARLRAMGYAAYESTGGIGLTSSVMRVRGGYQGMDDPRSSGGATGF
ncbi:MAG: gamma-glutamyltransferase [Gemmatimonadaceae bacterium]|nr:gamma-glutamyltransferase [Gemmatimonadaceae bacterium]